LIEYIVYHILKLCFRQYLSSLMVKTL